MTEKRRQSCHEHGSPKIVPSVLRSRQPELLLSDSSTALEGLSQVSARVSSEDNTKFSEWRQWTWSGYEILWKDIASRNVWQRMGIMFTWAVSCDLGHKRDHWGRPDWGSDLGRLGLCLLVASRSGTTLLYEHCMLFTSVNWRKWDERTGGCKATELREFEKYTSWWYRPREGEDRGFSHGILKISWDRWWYWTRGFFLWQVDTVLATHYHDEWGSSQVYS